MGGYSSPQVCQRKFQRQGRRKRRLSACLMQCTQKFPLAPPASTLLAFWPQLLLWFTLLETAATGVSTGDILSAYLYLLSGSNATVGYIQVP